MPGSLERQKLRKEFVQMLEKIIHANASNEIVGRNLCAFEDNHSFFLQKMQNSVKSSACWRLKSNSKWSLIYVLQLLLELILKI